MSSPVRAYVGLGSNLDDPVTQVRTALATIASEPGIELLAASSLYRTAPVGDAAQEDFVNAVCSIRTVLGPGRLLGCLKAMEAAAGRRRDPERPLGPRILDLDLLLYGPLQLARTGLVIPHPRMHERRFVLEPLVEVDPTVRIPGRGMAADWLAACSDQRVERFAAVEIAAADTTQPVSA